ncbi:MAG: TonB family protein [Acidobacteria bacterium]|nr:TonB family protein [Acidobacteriota bacterium]
MGYRVAVVWLVAMGVFGQETKAPQLKRKVEPQYTQEARENGVQGSVLFRFVVGANGKVTEIELISPLGYGLDEQAKKALEQWEFEPGRKDGMAVEVDATVEVNFRLMGRAYDAASERRRSDFNAAWATMQKDDSKPEMRVTAQKKIEELSQQKYAPAMYVVGMWRVAGENGPKDEAGGLELIQRAGQKQYGPAAYQIALRRMRGAGLPQDRTKGLEEMERAAMLGSVQAQFYLAGLYELGTAAARDLALAQRYYRMCAGQGVGRCQHKLGTLMLGNEDRREHLRLQAIAWLELAAEQESAAAELARKEAAGLSEKQIAAVKRLKGQLVRK